MPHHRRGRMLRHALRVAAVLCVGAVCAQGQTVAEHTCADKNGAASCAQHLKVYVSQGNNCSRVPASDEIANYIAGQPLSHYCQDTCNACATSTPTTAGGCPPLNSPSHAPAAESRSFFFKSIFARDRVIRAHGNCTWRTNRSTW